jgi:predicted anti-sigma-YlaC factor YlaD
MRCRRAQKLLSRRVDGAASSVDAAALDSHLVGCVACRLAAARLEQAWQALGALEEGISAPDDWARIEAAAEARRWRWTPFWLGWQLAPVRPAAAGVLAAMVVLGTTGGVLLSRAALAPQRAGSIESRIFAETLGELPWGSPAAGLAGVFGNSTAQEEDR